MTAFAYAPRPTLDARTDIDEQLEGTRKDPIRSPLATPAGQRVARIVVGEDDPEMRRLLVTQLRRDGHDVLAARDGAELLEQLDRFWANGREPDLVITDVRMPRCNGLQVLAHMKEDERHAPVILITAFGDHDLHDRAANLGALAVVDKPFDLARLRDLVRRAVNTEVS